MSGTTAIVTDSTACLPPELSSGYGVVVVPLRVVIAGRAHDETGISAAQVHDAAGQGVRPTTSRPAPATFARVYSDAAAAGATGIVSIHASGHLSGTVDSARIAGRAAPVPVKVVDSRSIGAGLGFTVLASAAAARAQRPLDEVAAIAARRSARVRSLFCVVTLEHLLSGGRFAAMSARIGNALGVKPLLHIVDGRIVLLEKARTVARAMARLEHLAAEFATGCGAAEVDLAVQHVGSGERARDLAGRLRESIPLVRQVHITEVGPAIATHTGPGMLGVAVAPV